MQTSENIRFLLREGQAVFGDGICLYLRHTAVEKHADGRLPAYYFHILRLSDGADMGWLDLRAGNLEDTGLYGHLSYCLFRPYRGRGITAKAVSLLLPLAQRHGLSYLYINCSADNLASQGVCRKLGAAFDTEVPQPDGTSRLRFCLTLQRTSSIASLRKP